MTLAPSKFAAVAAYMAAIVLVNWLFTPSAAFEGITQWQSPWGQIYLSNIIVGFVFVLRDYAQRAIGHKILLATVLAGVMTYFVALWSNTPDIAKTLALASVTAFLVSEMLDWSIFSFWKKPLQQRILVSSLVAVPLDTAIFQNMAGYYTPAAFSTEVLCKIVGVAVVWFLLKSRARGNDDTVTLAQTSL
jgi:queuosine precursor transporter